MPMNWTLLQALTLQWATKIRWAKPGTPASVIDSERDLSREMCEVFTVRYVTAQNGNSCE